MQSIDRQIEERIFGRHEATLPVADMSRGSRHLALAVQPRVAAGAAGIADPVPRVNGRSDRTLGAVRSTAAASSYPDGDPGRAQSVPPYSQDIEAAWKVVERLRDLGCTIHIRTMPAKRYAVFCLWPLSKNEDILCVEESIALAICRAALRAMEQLNS